VPQIIIVRRCLESYACSMELCSMRHSFILGRTGVQGPAEPKVKCGWVGWISWSYDVQWCVLRVSQRCRGRTIVFKIDGRTSRLALH